MVLKHIKILFLAVIMFTCFSACETKTPLDSYNNLLGQVWEKAKKDEALWHSLQELLENRTYNQLASFFMASADDKIFSEHMECDYYDKQNECLKEIVLTGLSVRMLEKLAADSNQEIDLKLYNTWVDNILSGKRTFTDDEIKEIYRKL